MNNIPVSAYNPTQRERFRRRLLLFYSVHDPEGSGRVSNALILKIPEAMVMSGLYSKYNVGFEEEERIARQKGLLPEQQQHFNAMEMINNNNNSNNNGSAPPTVVTGGEFENNGLNSFATGSAHDLSGMMAGVVNSDNSGNNLRHRASTVSNNNNNNNLFLPSDQNNQSHPQDFGPMQQSVSNFSAQPSFAVGKDQANISGTNLVGNSADTPTPHQNNNNNNNTSPFVFRTNEVTPVTPQRPSLRRDSVAAGSGSGGSGGGSAGTPSGNSAFPSLPQQQQQQQQQQQSSSTSSYPEVSVNSLPETEKQRVQKRVDRFYKRYFPEGAWKAQEARSSYMTESDLFESLCSSYKVLMAEERVLAAELLPDSQKGKSDSNNNSPVTSAAAAESIRQWYEEQLKKLETQHKQELFEEKEQRWKLEQENERVTKEKLQESKKSAEVREKLQVDLLDAKKAILEKERERDRLLEQQQKLIRESQTAQVVVEKEKHETREIGLCTTASLGGRSSTATSVGGDAGGGLEFGIRSRSDSLIGNNFSDNSNNNIPSPSSATAIEAQLIFLKNELAAAKNYSESLDRVHKAEMEEKESELILRLQEKAALERRLSEESQLSPSRRNLLYEKGGSDNQGNNNNNHSKTLVGEDEDLPPDSPPPPLRSSSSSPPSPLSRHGNKPADPNSNNNNNDSNHKIVDDGNRSDNNFHISPSERRHRDRLEKLQQHKMGLHYMNNNNNNHNSPSRAFTIMATLSASSTISTPASPVRVKGHASPEHPLLMVCGICGEQGRDRFCHNCGANYYDGEEIILQ